MRLPSSAAASVASCVPAGVAWVSATAASEAMRRRPTRSRRRAAAAAAPPRLRIDDDRRIGTTQRLPIVARAFPVSTPPIAVGQVDVELRVD